MNWQGWTEAEKYAIVDKYRRGYPVDAILDRHHISTDRLYDLLRRRNVPLRGSGQGSRPVPKHSAMLLSDAKINAPGSGEWDHDRILRTSQDRDARTAMDVAETFARGRTIVLVEYIEAYARARREAGIT